MSLKVGELHFALDVEQNAFRAGLAQSEAAAAAAGARIAGTLQVTAAATASATRQVGFLGGAFSGLGGVMAGALAGGVVVGQLTKLKDAASNLNEAVNMTGLIFGKSANAMVAWAEAGANAFGLSTTEALQAAAGYANLLQNVGLGQREAMAMSRTLVGLSGDMASAFNSSVPEAIQAISAGLRGEAEPLRRYGVMLDDVTLKQKAMELGLYSGTGVLDQSAKAQAAYALVLESTARIQGDFARTAEDPANAARVLAAEVENLRAAIGQRLLPAWKSVLNLANGTVQWANANEDAVMSLLELAAVSATVIGGSKALTMANGALLRSERAVAVGATTMGSAVRANFSAMADGAKTAAKAIALIEVAIAGVEAARSADRALEYASIMGRPGDNATVAFGGFANFLDQLPVVSDIYSAIGLNPMDLVDANRQMVADAKATQESLAGFTAQAEAQKQAAIQGTTSAVEQQRDAFLSTRDAIRGSMGGLFGETTAAQAIADTARTEADARRKLDEAQADYARIQSAYRPGSQERTDAAQRVDDARRAVQDAAAAADQARGLSQAELARRANDALANDRAVAAGMDALTKSGLTPDARLALLDVEKTAPGTINRIVSEGISKPFIESMNRSFREYNGLADTIAQMVIEAQAELEATMDKAGFALAAAWSRGWARGVRSAQDTRSLLPTPSEAWLKVNGTEEKQWNAAGLSMDPGTPGVPWGQNVYQIGTVTVLANDPTGFERSMTRTARQNNAVGR